jgi:uncharacterized protein (TIGR03663 family)
MKLWVACSLGAIIAVSLTLRFPKLGDRPMHNDEGVNAIKFGQFWQHGGYKYDPSEFHGPTLCYATAALGYLSCAPDFENYSEGRLRFVAVLFGIGVGLLLPLITEGLGAKSMLWAALFIGVSPAMVFYSRYYIHEIPLIFFTVLALTAGWRYWRSRKLGWALLCGAGIGLMQATKETFVFNLAAAGLALGVGQCWNRLLDGSGLPVKAVPLRPAHVLGGLAAWLLVWLLFFSSFFTNFNGLPDSVRTYFPWFARAGGASEHNYPWTFYLHRLIFFHHEKSPVWSEALILVLALIGVIAGFARRGLGETNGSLVRFLGLYTIILASLYSLISYKTPWCLLNFWVGAILLAGVGAALLVRSARKYWVRIAMIALILAGAGQLAAQAWQAAVPYAADQGNPYVFSPTSPDILRLIARVESLSTASPDSRRLVIKVMAPESDFWPLPWYLRSFKNVGWYDRIPPEPFAPVMIVSSRLHAGLDEQHTHLMTGYYKLRSDAFFELYVSLELWQVWLAKHPPTADLEQ